MHLPTVNLFIREHRFHACKNLGAMVYLDKDNEIGHHKSQNIQKHTETIIQSNMGHGHLSGWWFGTFLIFPYIWNFIIPIDYIIFFRGVETTSQLLSQHAFVSHFGPGESWPRPCRRQRLKRRRRSKSWRKRSKEPRTQRFLMFFGDFLMIFGDYWWCLMIF